MPNSISICQTVLATESISECQLTESQFLFSQSIQNFCSNAFDCYSIGGMMFGQMIGCIAKVHTLKLCSRFFGESRMARWSSYMISSGSSILCEGTFLHLTPQILKNGFLETDPWKGCLNSSLTIFSCKIVAAGKLSNPFLQHIAQNCSILGAEEVSSVLGLSEEHRGTLLERLVECEISNCQIGIGMGLGRQLCPEISHAEAIYKLQAELHEISFSKIIPGAKIFSDFKRSLQAASLPELVEGSKKDLLNQETREAEKEKLSPFTLMAMGDEIKGAGIPPRKLGEDLKQDLNDELNRGGYGDVLQPILQTIQASSRDQLLEPALALANKIRDSDCDTCWEIPPLLKIVAHHLRRQDRSLLIHQLIDIIDSSPPITDPKTDPQRRSVAVVLLGDIVPLAPVADRSRISSKILSLLSDENPFVRKEALISLGKIIPALKAEERLIPTLQLIKIIPDKDSIQDQQKEQPFKDLETPTLQQIENLLLHLQKRDHAEVISTLLEKLSTASNPLLLLGVCEHFWSCLEREIRFDFVKRLWNISPIFIPCWKPFRETLEAVMESMTGNERQKIACHILERARKWESSETASSLHEFLTQAVLPSLDVDHQIRFLGFLTHFYADSETLPMTLVEVTIRRLPVHVLSASVTKHRNPDLKRLVDYYEARLPWDNYFWREYKAAPDPALWIQKISEEIEPYRRGKVPSCLDKRSLHLAYAGLDAPEGLTIEHFLEKMSSSSAPEHPPFLNQQFKIVVKEATALTPDIVKQVVDPVILEEAVRPIRQIIAAGESKDRMTEYKKYIKEFFKRETALWELAQSYERLDLAAILNLKNSIEFKLKLREFVARFIVELEKKDQNPKLQTAIQEFNTYFLIYSGWELAPDNMREKITRFIHNHRSLSDFVEGLRAIEEFYRDTVEDSLKIFDRVIDKSSRPFHFPFIFQQRDALRSILKKLREKRRTGKRMRAKLLPSKNQADQFFAYVAEDCNKEKGDVIYRKDFQLYRIVCQKKLAGMLYLQEAILDGNRVLVMAIQPRTSWKIDHVSFIKSLRKKMARIGFAKGYDYILLSEEVDQQGNRLDTLDAIREENLQPISFSQEIPKAIFRGKRYLVFWSKEKMKLTEE